MCVQPVGGIMTLYRIGQIVPSSNVTMETEIPALLKAREAVGEERYTFHSARMRMKTVTKSELASMDAESDRCALELSDARVDVMGYACLVAIMAMGPGYHRESSARLREITSGNGADAPVVASAGALVEALHAMSAKKVAIIMPYMTSIAELVVDYIQKEGIEVVDHRALEIQDNLKVAAHDPMVLPSILAQMNTGPADAVVLSACVQMPSLPAIALAEHATGKPVLSASIATTWQMLKELGIERRIPGGGALLSGAY